MDTETIDRLFLELSQVTNAVTEKEILLKREIKKAFMAGLSIGNSPNFKMSITCEDEWLEYKKLHNL